MRRGGTALETRTPESRPASGERQPGLRILHLDSGRVWRGGQRQAFLLVKALRERGHECLCAFRSGAPLAARAAAVGLDLLPYAPRGEWDVHAAARLRRLLLERRPHVLHAHDNHSVSLALLSARGACPIVASRRVPFRSGRNLLNRLKLRSVARWLAVSRSSRDGLIRAGVSSRRVQVVYSGIELPSRETPAAAVQPSLRARLGMPSDVFLILTAAWVGPVKGQRTFVEACALARDLENARWVVAGRGPDRRFLERLATELGVQSHVVFAGQIEDLPLHMQEVQVCVLASFREGLGTVLLDALAAGVPVVGTDAAGIPELITDGLEGRLVPVGDARSVAEAVRQLYLDPKLRQEMGGHGRRRVRDFSIDATAEETIATYRAVVAERRRSSRNPALPPYV